MKKIRLAFAIILAAALLCIVFVCVACNGNDIAELRVENAKINFMKGDEFEKGENFKVFADYKDGTSVDVTDETEIRMESGMDMNVVGDYQITVIYGEKRVIYTVYVNDSDDILRKIELDSSNVKKQYQLGDEISFDGLVLNLTYENSHGVVFSSSTTSLSGFTVSVNGQDGSSIDKVFTSLGSFTVSVAQGSVKSSYDVTVDGVNISTVQGALTVGGYFKYKALSGSIISHGARGADDNSGDTSDNTVNPSTEPYVIGKYEYIFGKNYTYFKETSNPPLMEYHCSLIDNDFFVTHLQDGIIKTSNINNSAMMNGAPFILWYSSEVVYGAESALNNLYSNALQCSNKDLVETVDEAKRKYSFEFSGLKFRDRNSDYYETKVTFTLGEDYVINSLTIDQYYYENNSGLAEQEGYSPTFITDEVTGITTPNGAFTYRTIINAVQTSGERTLENPYNRDMFKVSSYSVSYNDKQLDDSSVVELNSGNTYVFKISDVKPSTANLAVDQLYFDFEGNTGVSDTWLNNEHFTIIRSDSEIRFSARHGGTWVIVLKTANTTKKLTVKIIGEAPEDMMPKLYNSTSKSFYDGNEKTLSIGGETYFYGAVDRYANSAQTAAVTSENSEFASITAATVNGIDCWKFSATQAGTYQITVVSDVASLTSCIFMFTVSETADYGELLSGTYTTKDQVGNVYRVTFNMTEGENLSGTVAVTRTPTDENDNLLTNQAVSQTLNVYVDGLSIIVENKEPYTVWVEFSVDADNNLVLIDQRGGDYILARPE